MKTEIPLKLPLDFTFEGYECDFSYILYFLLLAFLRSDKYFKDFHHKLVTFCVPRNCLGCLAYFSVNAMLSLFCSFRPVESVRRWGRWYRDPDRRMLRQFVYALPIAGHCASSVCGLLLLLPLELPVIWQFKYNGCQWHTQVNNAQTELNVLGKSISLNGWGGGGGCGCHVCNFSPFPWRMQLKRHSVMPGMFHISVMQHAQFPESRLTVGKYELKV